MRSLFASLVGLACIAIGIAFCAFGAVRIEDNSLDGFGLMGWSIIVGFIVVGSCIIFMAIRMAKHNTAPMLVHGKQVIESSDLTGYVYEEDQGQDWGP